MNYHKLASVLQAGGFLFYGRKGKDERLMLVYGPVNARRSHLIPVSQLYELQTGLMLQEVSMLPCPDGLDSVWKSYRMSLRGKVLWELWKHPGGLRLDQLVDRIKGQTLAPTISSLP